MQAQSPLDSAAITKGDDNISSEKNNGSKPGDETGHTHYIHIQQIEA